MADIIQPNGALLTPQEMQIQQQAIDRQRAIATALQQASMQSPEGQMVSGHYVAPNAMQYIAKLAQGLIGKNQQDMLDQKGRDLATTQGNMMRNQFGVSDTQQQGALPSQGTQNAIQTGMAQGAQAGSVGPTPDNLMRVAKVLQDQKTQPSNTQPQVGSRVLDGMNPVMAFQLYNSDPKTYDAAYLKQFEPTEFSKDLRLVPENMRSAAITQKFLPPIVNRGFGVLTTGPDGKLQNDPASMAGIDQAKAIEGKYGAPITLNRPDGSTIQLSPAEFAKFQENGGKLPFRFLPPEMQTGIQNDANTSGSPADVNIQTKQGMVSDRVTPQSNAIGTSQSTFGQALDRDEAGRVSKMTEDIYDKGTHAIDKVAQNNKMIELLPQITTGPLNKQITMVKNLAASLGADLGDPAPNQEFEKYAIQGALASAKQIYGSRITNQDVTTQIMSNPGATLTEKAIYQLLKYDNELQQRNIQKMTALGEYRRAGGDPREFQVYFSQKYPFQGISAPEEGGSKDFKINTPAPVKPGASPKAGQPNYQELYGIKLK